MSVVGVVAPIAATAPTSGVDNRRAESDSALGSTKYEFQHPRCATTFGLPALVNAATSYQRRIGV